MLQAALLFAIADGNADEVEQAHHYLTLALLTVHPLKHSYSADLRSSAVSNETLIRSLDALLQYTANLQQRAADFITAEVGWEVVHRDFSYWHYCNCIALLLLTGTIVRPGHVHRLRPRSSKE